MIRGNSNHRQHNESHHLPLPVISGRHDVPSHLEPLIRFPVHGERNVVRTVHTDHLVPFPNFHGSDALDPRHCTELRISSRAPVREMDCFPYYSKNGDRYSYLVGNRDVPISQHQILPGQAADEVIPRKSTQRRTTEVGCYPISSSRTMIASPQEGQCLPDEIFHYDRGNLPSCLYPKPVKLQLNVKPVEQPPELMEAPDFVARPRNVRVSLFSSSDTAEQISLKLLHDGDEPETEPEPENMAMPAELMPPPPPPDEVVEVKLLPAGDAQVEKTKEHCSTGLAVSCVGLRILAYVGLEMAHHLALCSLRVLNNGLHVYGPVVTKAAVSSFKGIRRGCKVFLHKSAPIANHAKQITLACIRKTEERCPPAIKKVPCIAACFSFAEELSEDEVEDSKELSCRQIESDRPSYHDAYVSWKESLRFYPESTEPEPELPADPEVYDYCGEPTDHSMSVNPADRPTDPDALSVFEGYPYYTQCQRDCPQEECHRKRDESPGERNFGNMRSVVPFKAAGNVGYYRDPLSRCRRALSVSPGRRAGTRKRANQGLNILAWHPPDIKNFSDPLRHQLLVHRLPVRPEPRHYRDLIQRPPLEDECLWRSTLRAYRKEMRADVRAEDALLGGQEIPKKILSKEEFERHGHEVSVKSDRRSKSPGHAKQHHLANGDQRSDQSERQRSHEHQLKRHPPNLQTSHGDGNVHRSASKNRDLPKKVLPNRGKVVKHLGSSRLPLNDKHCRRLARSYNSEKLMRQDESHQIAVSSVNSRITSDVHVWQNNTTHYSESEWKALQVSEAATHHGKKRLHSPQPSMEEAPHDIEKSGNSSPAHPAGKHQKLEVLSAPDSLIKAKFSERPLKISTSHELSNSDRAKVGSPAESGQSGGSLNCKLSPSQSTPRKAFRRRDHVRSADSSYNVQLHCHRVPHSLRSPRMSSTPKKEDDGQGHHSSMHPRPCEDLNTTRKFTNSRRIRSPYSLHNPDVDSKEKLRFSAVKSSLSFLDWILWPFALSKLQRLRRRSAKKDKGLLPSKTMSRWRVFMKRPQQVYSKVSRPNSGPCTPPRDSRNLVRDYSDVSRNQISYLQSQDHPRNPAKQRPLLENVPRLKIFLSRKDPHGLRILSERPGSPLQKGAVPIKSVDCKERVPKRSPLNSARLGNKGIKSKNMKTDSKLKTREEHEDRLWPRADCLFPFPFAHRTVGNREWKYGNRSGLSRAHKRTAPSQTLSSPRETSSNWPRPSGASVIQFSGRPSTSRSPQALSPSLSKFKKKMQAKYEYPMKSHLYRQGDMKPNLDGLTTSKFLSPEKTYFRQSFELYGDGKNESSDSQKNLESQVSTMDCEPGSKSKADGVNLVYGSGEKHVPVAMPDSIGHDEFESTQVPDNIHPVTSTSTAGDSITGALQNLSDSNAGVLQNLSDSNAGVLQNLSDFNTGGLRNLSDSITWEQRNLSDSNTWGQQKPSDSNSGVLQHLADSSIDSDTVARCLSESNQGLDNCDRGSNEDTDASSVDGQFQRNPEISKLLTAYKEALIKETSSLESVGSFELNAEQSRHAEPTVEENERNSEGIFERRSEGHRSEHVAQVKEKLHDLTEAYSTAGGSYVVDARGHLADDGRSFEFLSQEERIYDQQDLSHIMRDLRGGTSSEAPEEVDRTLALAADALQLVSQIPPGSAHPPDTPRLLEIELETVEELVIFPEKKDQEQVGTRTKDEVMVTELLEEASLLSIDKGDHDPDSETPTRVENELSSALVTPEAQQVFHPLHQLNQTEIEEVEEFQLERREDRFDDKVERNSTSVDKEEGQEFQLEGRKDRLAGKFDKSSSVDNEEGQEFQLERRKDRLADKFDNNSNADNEESQEFQLERREDRFADRFDNNSSVDYEEGQEFRLERRENQFPDKVYTNNSSDEIEEVQELQLRRGERREPGEDQFADEEDNSSEQAIQTAKAEEFEKSRNRKLEAEDDDVDHVDLRHLGRMYRAFEHSELGTSQLRKDEDLEFASSSASQTYRSDFQSNSSHRFEEHSELLPSAEHPRDKEATALDETLLDEKSALKFEHLHFQDLAGGRRDVSHIEEVDHQISSHAHNSERQQDENYLPSASSQLLVEEEEDLHHETLPHQREGNQLDTWQLQQGRTEDHSDSLGEREYNSVISSDANSRRGSEHEGFQIADDDEKVTQLERREYNLEPRSPISDGTEDEEPSESYMMFTRSTMIDQNFPQLKFPEKLAAWEMVARSQERPPKSREKGPSDDIDTVKKFFVKQNEPSRSEARHVRGLDLAEPKLKQKASKRRGPQDAPQEESQLGSTTEYLIFKETLSNKGLSGSSLTKTVGREGLVDHANDALKIEELENVERDVNRLRNLRGVDDRQLRSPSVTSADSSEGDWDISFSENRYAFRSTSNVHRDVGDRHGFDIVSNVEQHLYDIQHHDEASNPRIAAGEESEVQRGIKIGDITLGRQSYGVLQEADPETKEGGLRTQNYKSSENPLRSEGDDAVFLKDHAKQRGSTSRSAHDSSEVNSEISRSRDALALISNTKKKKENRNAFEVISSVEEELYDQETESKLLTISSDGDNFEGDTNSDEDGLGASNYADVKGIADSPEFSIRSRSESNYDTDGEKAFSISTTGNKRDRRVRRSISFDGLSSDSSLGTLSSRPRRGSQTSGSEVRIRTLTAVDKEAIVVKPLTPKPKPASPSTMSQGSGSAGTLMPVRSKSLVRPILKGSLVAGSETTRILAQVTSELTPATAQGPSPASITDAERLNTRSARDETGLRRSSSFDGLPQSGSDPGAVARGRSRKSLLVRPFLKKSLMADAQTEKTFSRLQSEQSPVNTETSISELNPLRSNTTSARDETGVRRSSSFDGLPSSGSDSGAVGSGRSRKSLLVRPVLKKSLVADAQTERTFSRLRSKQPLDNTETTSSPLNAQRLNTERARDEMGVRRSSSFDGLPSSSLKPRALGSERPRKSLFVRPDLKKSLVPDAQTEQMFSRLQSKQSPGIVDTSSRELNSQSSNIESARDKTGVGRSSSFDELPSSGSDPGDSGSGRSRKPLLLRPILKKSLVADAETERTFSLLRSEQLQETDSGNAETRSTELKFNAQDDQSGGSTVVPTTRSERSGLKKSPVVDSETAKLVAPLKPERDKVEEEENRSEGRDSTGVESVVPVRAKNRQSLIVRPLLKQSLVTDSENAKLFARLQSDEQSAQDISSGRSFGSRDVEGRGEERPASFERLMVGGAGSPSSLTNSEGSDGRSVPQALQPRKSFVRPILKQSLVGDAETSKLFAALQSEQSQVEQRGSTRPGAAFEGLLFGSRSSLLTSSESSDDSSVNRLRKSSLFVRPVLKQSLIADSETERSFARLQSEQAGQIEEDTRDQERRLEPRQLPSLSRSSSLESLPQASGSASNMNLEGSNESPMPDRKPRKSLLKRPLLKKSLVLDTQTEPRFAQLQSQQPEVIEETKIQEQRLENPGSASSKGLPFGPRTSPPTGSASSSSRPRESIFVRPVLKKSLVAIEDNTNIFAQLQADQSKAESERFSEETKQSSLEEPKGPRVRKSSLKRSLSITSDTDQTSQVAQNRSPPRKRVKFES